MLSDPALTADPESGDEVGAAVEVWDVAGREYTTGCPEETWEVAEE